VCECIFSETVCVCVCVCLHVCVCGVCEFFNVYCLCPAVAAGLQQPLVFDAAVK
jgi:hypothetical protein